MGNNRVRWFACGALAVCVTGLLCLVAFLELAHGFSARDEPSAAERWIARRARMAALPADAAKSANPVPDTPEVLAEARAHWADHCAACHANNGSGESLMGRRTYPPAPDMRRPETQQLTDGELFFIIQNGVRLTAMPAWAGPVSGSHHDAGDSWKLVRFIRHLPKLTAEEEAEMQELNPKSPDEFKEEQEEKEFLNGDQSHEHTPQHERH
jgi:mono/diheme cytochrome c family protein